MRILALDLALRTGWACNRPRRVDWGAIDVSKVKGLGPRLTVFRQDIRDLLHKLDPSIVYYERPCGHSGAAVDLARGFQAMLVVELTIREDIPAYTVAPNTLKKWATGNGRCGKTAMIDAASRLLGNYGMDHDEADAICLLHYAMEEVDARGAGAS